MTFTSIPFFSLFLPFGLLVVLMAGGRVANYPSFC